MEPVKVEVTVEVHTWTDVGHVACGAPRFLPETLLEEDGEKVSEEFYELKNGLPNQPDARNADPVDIVMHRGDLYSANNYTNDINDDET